MKTKRRRWSRSCSKAQFGFDDYLESMNQMKNMGGISKYSEHDAGYGRSTDEADLEDAIDEKQMARIEAIILSMTPKERANPDLLNPSRKQQNCRWSRRGYQRGEPAGETV